MAWIFVDKEEEGGGQMRQQMRRNMRGGYHRYGAGQYRGNDGYHEGYRQGYKHGWEDYEDEDMDFRRQRDSRGRFV